MFSRVGLGSCASEGRGTSFERLDESHTPRLLRSIVPRFFFALVSLSDQTWDIDSLDTLLVLGFPVIQPAIPAWVVRHLEK